MSDISVPLPYQTTAAHSAATARVVAERNPPGFWAVMGWSAAGIATIVAGATWGGRFGFYPALMLLPTIYIAVAATVAAPLWASGWPLRDYLALRPLRWSDIGLGVGFGSLGFVAFVVLLGLLALVKTALGDAGSSGPIMGKMPLDANGMLFLLSYWTAMVIAAPIVEEILFRGLLYRGLETRLGAFGAIVLTSVVFGLLHAPGFGWERVVGTGCLGLLLGWLRSHTGNTSVTIVTHATVNFIGAVLGTALMLLSS